MFEKAYAMAGVFKLVDVRPDLGLPRMIVRGGFAAGGATGMKTDRGNFRDNRPRQFQKDAANLLDLFILIEHVFVAQKVAEAQLTGFRFGLDAGVKWAIFRAQLLGRVASHPKGFFLIHTAPPRDCGAGSRLLPSPLGWVVFLVQFAFPL